MTLLLGGLIGLIWMAIGIAMISAPDWWRSLVQQALVDPFRRLLLTQGMILGGLLLILGTGQLRGAWLWMTLGFLTVAKGLVLLGIRDQLRNRWMAWWTRFPILMHRLTGVVLLVLASLLMIDLLGSAS
jgi:hypothetical protein